MMNNNIDKILRRELRSAALEGEITETKPIDLIDKDGN